MDPLEVAAANAANAGADKRKCKKRKGDDTPECKKGKKKGNHKSPLGGTVCRTPLDLLEVAAAKAANLAIVQRNNTTLEAKPLFSTAPFSTTPGCRPFLGLLVTLPPHEKNNLETTRLSPEQLDIQKRECTLSEIDVTSQ